jgi:hypothetical protein
MAPRDAPATLARLEPRNGQNSATIWSVYTLGMFYLFIVVEATNDC